MKIGLVVFGAGSPNWRQAARRLRSEGDQSGFFSVSQLYRWSDIESAFSEKEQKFIKSNARGFGYWLWKPVIIKKFFSDFPDIDYVLYLDAGCELNITPESKETFDSYCAILQRNEYLAFPMGLSESDWTKRDLLELMNVRSEDLLQDQVMSGVLFMSRKFANSFCDRWKKLMMLDDFKYLDDSPSRVQEHSNFKEHRHDQSLLSLLLKEEKTESFIHKEQFHFPPKWESAGKYPIWTTRNRTRVKLQDQSFKGKMLRFIDYKISKVNLEIDRIRTKFFGYNGVY